jgi:hypothetical protein
MDAERNWPEGDHYFGIKYNAALLRVQSRYLIARPRTEIVVTVIKTLNVT